MNPGTAIIASLPLGLGAFFMTEWSMDFGAAIVGLFM